MRSRIASQATPSVGRANEAPNPAVPARPAAIGNQAMLRHLRAGAAIGPRFAAALQPPPAVLADASDGAPLDAAARDTLEPRAGVDLSAVRIHTDAPAHAAASALGARAFTRGDDVYFAAGRGPGDRSLLAHEVAHVAQQASGRARALDDGGGRAALEAEARRFAGGGALAPSPRVAASAAIQLDTESELDAELHHRFSANAAEALQRQRATLVAICERAPPAEASELLTRLDQHRPPVQRRLDPLAEQFHSTLHVAWRRDCLAALRRAATVTPPVAPVEPVAPVAPVPPTRTSTWSFEMDSDSASQTMVMHTTGPRDDPAYIDPTMFACAFGLIDGYSVLFSHGGPAQEISVPLPAVDLAVELVDDVGNGQIFDDAAAALAAVNAAGGPNNGERRRIAYYRLLGAIVPTIFCPGTTPRIIAGWRELHRRLAEIAGGLGDGLQMLMIHRVVAELGGRVGQRVIRASQTAPLTWREWMRRYPILQPRLPEIPEGPLPNSNVQWGQPIRGDEHVGTPPVRTPPNRGTQPVPPPNNTETVPSTPPRRTPTTPQVEEQISAGGVTGPRRAPPPDRLDAARNLGPPITPGAALPNEVLRRPRESIASAVQWVHDTVRSGGFSGELQVVYIIRGTGPGPNGAPVTRVLKVGIGENTIQNNRIRGAYEFLPTNTDVQARGIQLDIEVVVVRRSPPLSRIELRRTESEVRLGLQNAGERLPWDFDQNEANGSIVPSRENAGNWTLDENWRWIPRTGAAAVVPPVSRAPLFLALQRIHGAGLRSYLTTGSLNNVRLEQLMTEALAAMPPAERAAAAASGPLSGNTIRASWLPYLGLSN